MNFRNKYLVTIVRIIFGLLLLFSGVSGLLMGPNAEGTPESMVVISHALWDGGIFQLIKVVEIIAGLLFIANIFPALAVLFVAPIAIGVIVFTGRLMPAFVISGIIVALLDAYFVYVYWKKFKPLFVK